MFTTLATLAITQIDRAALVVGGLFAGFAALFAVWFIVSMNARIKDHSDQKKQDQGPST